MRVYPSNPNTSDTCSQPTRIRKVLFRPYDLMPRMKKPGSGLVRVSAPWLVWARQSPAAGAEQGRGELDRAAGGVALVDLELAVELVVADEAGQGEDAVDLDLLGSGAVAQSRPAILPFGRESSSIGRARAGRRRPARRRRPAPRPRRRGEPARAAGRPRASPSPARGCAAPRSPGCPEPRGPAPPGRATAVCAEWPAPARRTVLPAQSGASPRRSGTWRRISRAERPLAGAGMPPSPRLFGWLQVPVASMTTSARSVRLPAFGVGDEQPEGAPPALRGGDLLVLEQPLAADRQHPGAEAEVGSDRRQRRDAIEQPLGQLAAGGALGSRGERRRRAGACAARRSGPRG